MKKKLKIDNRNVKLDEIRSTYMYIGQEYSSQVVITTCRYLWKNLYVL